MRRALMLLPVLGCQLEEPGGSGIAIGNPPGTAEARISLAEADGVSFTSLALPIVGLYLETCDPVEGRVVDLPRTVLGVRNAPIEVSAGTYCGLGLVPETDADTVLEGTADGGTFTFTEPLGRIELFGEVELRDGDAIVLELARPDWIEPAAFGLAAGEHVDIGGERCVADPLCARMRASLMDQAGLYTDDDADGEVDTPERDRGESATGDARRD